MALAAPVAEKGKTSMKKQPLEPRDKKIALNRETLRKLEVHEYEKVAGGTSSPSFSHLPHCPLCC
jgi:hypothetical protein